MGSGHGKTTLHPLPAAVRACSDAFLFFCPERVLCRCRVSPPSLPWTLPVICFSALGVGRCHMLPSRVPSPAFLCAAPAPPHHPSYACPCLSTLQRHARHARGWPWNTKPGRLERYASPRRSHARQPRPCGLPLPTVDTRETKPEQHTHQKPPTDFLSQLQQVGEGSVRGTAQKTNRTTTSRSSNSNPPPPPLYGRSVLNSLHPERHKPRAYTFRSGWMYTSGSSDSVS